jgi:PKHD-type hydroxylase
MFTDSELNDIENYCEKFDKERGLTPQPDDSLSIRNSKIAWFNREKHPELNFLFEKLNFSIEKINEEYYNFDLNGYESIQYTTYDGNNLDNYGYHIDMNTDGYKNLDDPLLVFGDTRKLSLSLILSDSKSYVGGKFTIKISENDEIEIEQKRGRIIFFPSFFLHKVHPVTKGVRKSIVTWVEGPKFI